MGPVLRGGEGKEIQDLLHPQLSLNFYFLVALFSPFIKCGIGSSTDKREISHGGINEGTRITSDKEISCGG